MEFEPKPKPGFLWSVLRMKCPRCRRGNMFNESNAYKKLSLKHMLDMPEHCPVCRQKFDMEPGFWYGTGYMSYGITVILSALSFIAWWLIFGVSTHDNRIFYWLVLNAILLIVWQPFLMRLSRVLYIYLFVHYDPNYEKNKPQRLN